MSLQRLTIVLVLLGSCLTLGCHRSFYREQADLEAYDIIAEKSVHPHWDLDNFGIDPDPLSRMAAFDNPDCPPMPFDDPVAHDLGTLQGWGPVGGTRPSWGFTGEGAPVHEVSWIVRGKSGDELEVEARSERGGWHEKKVKLGR